MNKKSFFRYFSILFLLAFSAPLVAQPMGWTPFKAKEEGFSAYFPTLPIARYNWQQTATGPQSEQLYESQSSAGSFWVGRTTLPGEALLLGGPELVLSRAARNYQVSSGILPLGESNTVFQGQPARRVTFRALNGNIGEALFVLSKDQKKLLSFVGQSSGRHNVAAFLNSVQLIK